MTRNQIAQLMQDSAGFDWGNEAHFQRFAAIVEQHAAAAEREECAKTCEGMARPIDDEMMSDAQWIASTCARSIRARGET